MDDEPDNPLIISDDQQLVLPELVDDDFANALMLRGKRSRKELFVRLLCCMLGGGVLGLVSVIFNFNWLPIAAIAFILAVVIGIVLTNNVERAMQANCGDETAKLLPKAIHWTALFSPFTQLSLVRLVQLQLNLILIEGRYAELEILSLFAAGYTDPSARLGNVPKNWAVANNLAIAHMQQGRYAEGAKMFSAALAIGKNKLQQMVLIQNLSYCQMRLNEIEAAVENNRQALLLSGRETKTFAGCLILATEAMLKTKQGLLDDAESLILNLKTLIGKKQMTPHLVIILESTMAEIRFKQKRYDEAKLYFDNTLDLMLSADNPNYLGVAQIERDYAKCLEESGDTAGAQKAQSRAQECFNFYLQREIDTLELVKNRLADAKTIRYGTQLLDLAHRARYVPSIDLRRDVS